MMVPKWLSRWFRIERRVFFVQTVVIEAEVFDADFENAVLLKDFGTIKVVGLSDGKILVARNRYCTLAVGDPILVAHPVVRLFQESRWPWYTAEREIRLRQLAVAPALFVFAGFDRERKSWYVLVEPPKKST